MGIIVSGMRGLSLRKKEILENVQKKPYELLTW